MTRMASDPDPRGTLAWWRASLLALALGTLVLAVRLGGTSPLWSPDTINDEKFVRTCLDQDACYWFGMGTSVEWVQHGANFLHVKTLLRFLGASDRALHWILHAMLALAVVFTALTGSRLSGRFAGVVAGLLVAPLLLVTDLHLDVTYNHRVLPVLGALVALLAVRAVARGRTPDLALAAGLAGLATNVHMECAPFAVAVPLVAFLRPGGRLRAFLVALGSFAATAFLTSPDAWLSNLSALVHHEVPPPLAIPARTASGFGVVAAAALLAAGGLAVARPRRFPRTWLVPPLLAGPKVVGTEAAALLGLIEPEAKYYIEVVPVVAVTLVLGPSALLAGARAAWPRAGRLTDRLRSSRALLAAAVIAPGVVIASWPVPPGRGPRSERSLTMLSDQEVRALRGFLTTDLGWDSTAILRGLRGPLAFDALDLLVNLDPGPWRPGGSRRTATFAKVRTATLPDTLPPGFRVLASADGASLVAQVSDSWLDVGQFRACSVPRSSPEAALSCVETGIARVPWAPGTAPTALPGMPPVRRGQDITLRIEFAVHFPPNGTGVREVWMPPLRHGCSGRVIQVPAGRSRVLDGGRGAVLVPGGADAGTLVLEWRLGTPECGDWTYKGFVPFFVEVEPGSVGTWKTLLAPLLAPAGPDGTPGT